MCSKFLTDTVTELFIDTVIEQIKRLLEKKNDFLNLLAILAQQFSVTLLNLLVIMFSRGLWKTPSRNKLIKRPKAFSCKINIEYLVIHLRKFLRVSYGSKT